MHVVKLETPTVHSWLNERCCAGTQQRTVTCMSGGSAVAPGSAQYNDSCLPLGEPATQQACMYAPCSLALWSPGPWSQCAAGQQSRVVQCVDLSLSPAQHAGKSSVSFAPALVVQLCSVACKRAEWQCAWCSACRLAAESAAAVESCRPDVLADRGCSP